MDAPAPPRPAGPRSGPQFILPRLASRIRDHAPPRTTRSIALEAVQAVRSETGKEG